MYTESTLHTLHTLHTTHCTHCTHCTLQVMTKTPGMSFSLQETELDLTYKSRYRDAR